jgi:hypothetical protein
MCHVTLEDVFRAYIRPSLHDEYAGAVSELGNTDVDLLLPEISGGLLRDERDSRVRSWSQRASAR